LLSWILKNEFLTFSNCKTVDCSMNPKREHIDEGIFTVSDVFTTEECLAMIARAESIGFEAASLRTSTGPKMLTQIRNNERVAFYDVGLAEKMWQRIRSFLPVLDGCVACGVDSHLRFDRYLPGQQFKLHKDGSARD